MLKIVIISIFVGFLLVVGLQVWLIQQAVKKLAYDNKPFTRVNPQATLKFLFRGDSTCLGTGAASNTQSVAGWFAQDFPQASIENISANGKTLPQLEAEFHPDGKTYDLVVLQIGGNDILKLVPLASSEKSLTTVIRRAKSMSKHVVILHSGNVGLAPVFIWPAADILTQRARNMRAMYIRKAHEEGVLYIDLFTERNNDLFLKNVDEYYSPDHLHPSGAGYRWWYERIRQTLDQAGVVLS